MEGTLVFRIVPKNLYQGVLVLSLFVDPNDLVVTSSVQRESQAHLFQ